MKKLTLIIAVIAGVCFLATSAQAQVIQNFSIEAYVPPADTVAYTVYRIDPGDGVPDTFTIVNTFNLDFLDLTLLDQPGPNGEDPPFIFLPDFFWGVDVGTSGGAGYPNVAFSYTDTANPNGALNDGSGLGGRGNIIYQKIVPGNPDTATVIRAESLQQTNISPDITNDLVAPDGFLRFLIGIATGEDILSDPNDPNSAFPNTAAPFTPGDAPGTYSGTLMVTTTFDPVP